MRGTRWAAATTASVLALLLVACTDGGDGEEVQDPTGDAPASTAAPYLLLDDPAWQLTEGVDYRAGLGRMADLDPDLDWFAEYDGPSVDLGNGGYSVPHVATSGHTAGLETRGGQMPGVGFQSDTLDGRDVLIAEAAGGAPAAIVIELASDYSVTILTYDENVDLRGLAGRLAPADEQQWLAAGGRLLDCAPFEPGCA